MRDIKDVIVVPLIMNNVSKEFYTSMEKCDLSGTAFRLSFKKNC